MSANYATVADVIALKRDLTVAETERAAQWIPIVSAALRFEAAKRGKDFDQMLADNSDLVSVAKSVTVDVVMRELMTSTDQEPMTQFSQSALGYSVSGSFLSPGGGMLIKRSELAKLGIARQRVGVLEPYAY